MLLDWIHILVIILMLYDLSSPKSRICQTSTWCNTVLYMWFFFLFH